MFIPPEISAEDVNWVCGVMGLPSHAFTGLDGADPRFAVIRRTDSVDVEACPGSGKTTLLVAKLAILARRWRWSRSGMCVLSHTNAARDEIANRLSASPEGAALLQYPHFIGTIHGFANEFLAIPYLRSKRNPIKMIDTDIALSRRWAKVPRATKAFLDRKNNGDGRAFLRYSRDDFGGGKMSTLGEHTPTYAAVRAICEESSREGYFCYDELFIWAGKLLDEQPAAAASLRARFPMLFIDEVQDNDESQSSLLHRVFMQGAEPCRRQRFGDSNQAIYQSAAVTAGATTDTFPGANRADLPNSFRFGGVTANLANPLGLTPQGLVGLGPGPHHPPTILLFNDGSVRSVLPEYGSLLRETFTEHELSSGVFTAVAGVHKRSDDDRIPRWMGHYAPAYDPDISSREAYPSSFSQFLMAGYRDARRTRLSQPIARAVAQGMLELLRRADHDFPQMKPRNPHAFLLTVLSGEALIRYKQLLDFLIMNIAAISPSTWRDFAAVILRVIAEETVGKAIGTRDFLEFLAWKQPDEVPAGSPTVASNFFAYPADDPKVKIRLGSVHSVKGETHTATLVLDSFFHDHHLSALKPWILGGKVGKGAEGSRMQGRLKLHYVAMTRPARLLCLAMRSDAFSANERVQLVARGWTIRECAPHAVEMPNGDG
ncbi:UvrD-helicase domain-containing protein [Rhizobium leguminosarum]|uniref:UvrD-helicase domain-containing protein n=1 Tax=Rhizobium leguminosarum TaxID=384 RepID=UPI0021BC15C5|nr:UvrD-helicase domain-containing protein [Rhizobium leguminosarum]